MEASVEFSIEYFVILYYHGNYRNSILIFTIFNNVSLDAVINNDNFVVNNFNFNDQIG
jgi:hypothetical protein